MPGRHDSFRKLGCGEMVFRRLLTPMDLADSDADAAASTRLRLIGPSDDRSSKKHGGIRQRSTATIARTSSGRTRLLLSNPVNANPNHREILAKSADRVILQNLILNPGKPARLN